MADDITVKESDFYKLITAVDGQRVELEKLRKEIQQLKKTLQLQQTPSHQKDRDFQSS